MKKSLSMAFITILTGSQAFGKTCEEAQVRIIFDKKNVIQKETLCSKKTSDNMLFYVSKSCLQDKCEILKRKKNPLEFKNENPEFGSPGFKLCMSLGGVPQSFEFTLPKNKDLWQSTDRCLFGKYDFVEISLLTKEWKSFIK